MYRGITMTGDAPEVNIFYLFKEKFHAVCDIALIIHGVRRKIIKFKFCVNTSLQCPIHIDAVITVNPCGFQLVAAKDDPIEESKDNGWHRSIFRSVGCNLLPDRNHSLRCVR